MNFIIIIVLNFKTTKQTTFKHKKRTNIVKILVRFNFEYYNYSLDDNLLDLKRLQLDQPFVRTVAGDEVGVRAALDNITFAEDNNFIGVLYRTQSVRYHYGGTVLHEFL